MAGYVVGSRVFPGRDITVEEKIETGDAQLDRDIADGRARLERLKAANAEIPHPGITKALDRMTKAGEQIFRELGRDPKKVTLVRRFMNYYLPTAEKLMEQYKLLNAHPGEGRKHRIRHAAHRIQRGHDRGRLRQVRRQSVQG